MMIFHLRRILLLLLLRGKHRLMYFAYAAQFEIIILYTLASCSAAILLQLLSLLLLWLYTNQLTDSWLHHWRWWWWFVMSSSFKVSNQRRRKTVIKWRQAHNLHSIRKMTTIHSTERLSCELVSLNGIRYRRINFRLQIVAHQMVNCAKWIQR